ncbi:hypothetical protein CSKR_104073 [Clonorchis sinensis]|uniref:Uncharacterized protein n=1 Tax=Clonorchis sinensis TaxID=79923 RepID=A0A3R7CMS2_CLOSI|nr:hypothetical protein CSKR_104073 [Clonorchis sinensis]
MTRRSVVRNRPRHLDFCLGLDNLTVSHPSCFLRPNSLEREFTDRKFRGSNPTCASRLPLSRLGQTGSIPALAQPSDGTAVRHRKGATAERITAVEHPALLHLLAVQKRISCAQ